MFRKAPGYRAVVTGGGHGLGRAIALSLSRRGAKVLVADVDELAARHTAADASTHGGRAVPTRCDVSQPREVGSLLEAADTHIGGVDLVVNNAGVVCAGPFEDLSLEDWRWVVDVNLWGVVYGCRTFVPRFRAQGRGRILNVASVAGVFSSPHIAPYNATKAAVISLSETLAAELADTRDVHVTVLCPAFVRTPILSRMRAQEQRHRERGEEVMRRFGADPDDVADRALRAVDAGRLYCFPQGDGRWIWRLKRLAPAPVARLVGTIHRRTEARHA